MGLPGVSSPAGLAAALCVMRSREERLALPPRMLLTHSGFGGQRGLSQKQEFGFGNRGSCSGAAVSVASNCEAVFSLSLQVADVCFLSWRTRLCRWHRELGVRSLPKALSSRCGA